MNKFLQLTVLATLLVAAYSTCPNLCSGHGSCTNDDVCVCYEGWVSAEGGDCSERMCPYSIAWVDAASAANKAHGLAECGNRGMCDRSNGVCNCFAPYTGEGCTRTTCPNDCNGHGTCEALKEFRTDVGDDFKYTRFGSISDPYTHDETFLWDQSKSYGCLCDPGWDGNDCNERLCPRGSYALFNDAQQSGEVQRIEVNAIYPDDAFQIAFTFRSRINEEFTTPALDLWQVVNVTGELGDLAVADEIEEHLESLPNKVVENVDVTFYIERSGTPQTDDRWVPRNDNTDANAKLVFLVTFTGDANTGDQFLLDCRTEPCDDDFGCYPRMINGLGNNNLTSCAVTETVAATSTNLECSGRGRCNTGTALCECFEGYTGEACSTQTALI